MIDKYTSNGLSQKEAQYLANAIKSESSFQQDEYAQALNRKTTKISAPQDALYSAEFMKNFREGKPKETTASFFNENLDNSGYKYAKGEVEPSKEYLDAFTKQRNQSSVTTPDRLSDLRNRKFMLPPEGGSALVEGMAGVALPIAVHYANQATHGEFNPLDIKSAGEGSEVEANHEQPYNSLRELYRQKKFEALK